MNRFFFDLVAAGRRDFDYHGRYFSDADGAHQHAQIISMDIGGTAEWQGGEVEVRDPAGNRLFTVPIVENAELSAAA